MYKKPSIKTFDISSIYNYEDGTVLTTGWMIGWANTIPGWHNQDIGD